MRLSLCTGQGVLQHPVTDLLVPGQTSPASHGRAPAVDGECGAVNETGPLRCQKHDGLRNLVRGRRTARWRLGGQLLEPSPMASVPSVRVGLGLTALTRTPRGPYSAAHVLVSRLRAALLEP